MKNITGGAAVAALVALVGCANDTGEMETSASTPTPVTTVNPTSEESAEAEPDTDGDGEEPDVDQAIEGYIEGIASLRPSVAREALEYSAPDSVAYAYLQHQINVAEAALDGGLQYDDSTVEAIDGGYELCDPLDANVCNEFTEIETVDGLVTNLLIDDTPPGPRLAVGDGSVIESRGVVAEFLSAYRSIASETLFVVVEIEAGDEQVELNLYSAIYRDTEGQQRQAANAMGPIEIGAESTATVALFFPEAEPGGTVTLDGYVGDDFSNTVELTLQTGSPS